MVSARIPKPDCAPTAPTVSVRPFNGWAEITLSEAHDDRGVTEIQLHCSTASDFTPSEGTLIAKLGPLDRRYLDHVPEGAMYHYRTLAVDTTGHVSEHASERTSADIAAPPDLSSTLRGAYRFNEGRGTDVFDSSGRNNTGVLHDGIWVEGKHGTALRLPMMPRLVPAAKRVPGLIEQRQLGGSDSRHDSTAEILGEHIRHLSPPPWDSVAWNIGNTEFRCL